MTDQERKAMEMALEALEGVLSDDKPYIKKSVEAIGFLRQALAQPEQEPVAYADPLDLAKDGNWDTFICKHASENHEGTRFKIPLFTAPPSKPWVSLTFEEIKNIWVANYHDTDATDAFAYAIEAALRSKNT